MEKNLLIIFFLTFSFEIQGKSLNLVKFTCEYSPDLIKKEQKNINSIDGQEFDVSLTAMILSKLMSVILTLII